MTERKSLTVLLERARTIDARKLALLAFLLGAAITILYRPFSQMEVGDAAIYDYIAQSILRGQVQYRDVVDIKGPLAPELSAASMVIGKAVGLRDIIAVRLLHVLMVGLLSALSFLVADAFFRSRAAGLIAFLIPLMFSTYIEMMIGGTQPKLPMMVFGMLSLWLIARDKPFWAGCCSMLSCLCWQPGLMFTGVAVLMFSRYLTSWRDLRALKALAGAIVPLSMMLAYFYSRGALSEMWAWTITYNYSVFGPAAKRGLVASASHLATIMNRVFHPDIVLVYGSAFGLLIFLVDRLRARVKQGGSSKSADLFADAIAIPPLIYLGFCLINIQGGPDLIPLVPFVGFFGAWFFVRAGRALARSSFVEKKTSGLDIRQIVPRIAIVVVLLLGLYRSARYKLDTWTIKDQDRQLQTVSSLLGPNDKIYVHGTVEILTLLGKPNLNPYVFLDWGADDFAAAQRQTSFNEMIGEMDTQAPKLVSISRLKKVNHGAELEKWVEDRYDKIESFSYAPLYIRKQ